MKIISQIDEFRQYRRVLNRNKIGFVPTMGYLHDGHLSLIDKSLEENQATIVSIFVNPTQFGPGEDLDRYPRDFPQDRQILEARSVDCIFFPDSDQIYGANYATFIEVKKLETVLCGKTRPTHFRGVTTVVLKLFNLVKPTTAYFGQKDAQQAAIIQKMVKDLNMNVKLKVLPTLREKDGLAMSSRNKYLSPKQRKDASVLYQALNEAKNMIEAGEKNTDKIKERMKKAINKIDSKIDYISIVDADSLKDVSVISGKALIALAVRIGRARLIDNIQIIADKK
ncbi:MAG: pantoate--beta-alanine ligase [Candidatus Aminicenantes bacterium]|nr:pantoate--beta-alanine ligase [Candidatus Aminicenantes bacterium]